MFFSGKLVDAKVYKLDEIPTGSVVHGPAIVIDNTQTIVVVPGAEAKILSSHVVIEMPSAHLKDCNDDEVNVVDPIKLSVFSHRFMSIAEQMGLTLQKTSISLNIKERLDFSCAVFGPEGDLVANAPRMTIILVPSPSTDISLTYIYRSRCPCPSR